MKKIRISLCLLAILVAGCREAKKIGFLSDYSKLEKVSDSMLMYSASDNPLTGYKSFIVEAVNFDASDTGLEPTTVSDLTQYIEFSAKKAVLSYYDLSDKPAENTAVLRVSLISVSENSPIMAINPDAKTLGGATIEVEILDSLTNNTLISLVGSRADKQVELSDLSKWTQARNTVDQWINTLENVIRQTIEIEKFTLNASTKDKQAQLPTTAGTTIAQNIE